MRSSRNQFGVVDVQKEIEAPGAKGLWCKLSFVCFPSGVLVCSPLPRQFGGHSFVPPFLSGEGLGCTCPGAAVWVKRDLITHQNCPAG